jgi:hypothetical protein
MIIVVIYLLDIRETWYKDLKLLVEGHMTCEWRSGVLIIFFSLFSYLLLFLGWQNGSSATAPT